MASADITLRITVDLPSRSRLLEAIGNAMYGPAWLTLSDDDVAAVEGLTDGALAWLRANIDAAGSGETQVEAADEHQCGQLFSATFRGHNGDSWGCTLPSGHDGPHDWPEGRR